MVGDFADQQGIPLPTSYLTFQSSDDSIASVSPNGLLHATRDGSATVRVASHGVQAATAVTIGTPESSRDQLLYSVGLNAYPGAVTLSDGGTRQFQVYARADLALATNLTGSSAGTRYYVNRPGVVTVSADGLIQAVADGTATVTVINGPAESVVPIRVAAPGAAGPVVLGADGGVAQSVDGSYVAVPPGDLPVNTTVSIAPATLSDLPQAVPDGFKFAAAFNLDMGTNPLAVPAQLHVKVDPSIPAGTTVYFFQAGDYLNDDGTTRPIWWQVDNGEVGADGMAHTHSRPFPGITATSKYLVAYGSQDLAAVQLEQALTQQLTFSMALQNLSGGGFMGATSVSDVAGISATIAVPSSPDPIPFRIQLVPHDSLPVTTVSNFQLDASPGRLNTFTTNFVVPPTPVPTAPQIQLIKVDLNPADPVGAGLREVVLTGDHFNDKGQPLVDFLLSGPHGTDKTVEGKLASISNTELRVVVPDTVTLGLARIMVTRADETPTLDHGKVVQVVNFVSSDKVSISVDGTYVFVALPEAKYASDGVEGDLAVLNGDENDPATLGDLIAKIPLGTPKDNPFPRDVAVTPDNTRAYVTLRGSGRVAVVDAVTLQEPERYSGPNADSQVSTSQRRFRRHWAELCIPKLAVVRADHVRHAGLPARAEGGFDRLGDDLAVDHGPGVAIALLSHAHEVQAAHDVGGRQLAQRDERRSTLARHARELRERESVRFS